MDIGKISNVQLVHRCAQKTDDDQAWQEFVNRFHQHIVLTVLRLVSASSVSCGLDEATVWELVRDLAQDVYLRLLRREALKRFHGRHEKSIYSYLTKIVISVVRDRQREGQANKRDAHLIPWSELRRQERPRSTLSEAPLITQDLSYVDEHITILDLKNQLEHLLEGERKQRDILVFMLHVFDGLTASDIAAQDGFGLTPEGVESVLRRIKQKLREAMELKPKQQTD